MKKDNLLIAGAGILLVILASFIIAIYGEPQEIPSKTQNTTNTTNCTTITQTSLIAASNKAKKPKKKKVIKKKKVVKKKATQSAVQSAKYKITHYGPNCRGCSGITASGYNVRNTIYYNDSQYGQVRIVATSKAIPLYSIIRINNYGNGNFIAIVLDRGVGNGVIDILVESEKRATQLGIKKNASVDILRRGK